MNGEESLALADIYSILLREPYSLSMDDIRHATDRQITELFFRPEVKGKAETVSEPENEEDIRQWCAMAAASMGLADEKATEWIEKSVTAWREEQAENGEDSSGQTITK